MRFVLFCLSLCVLQFTLLQANAKPPLVQRVDHLTLPINDLAKARWFYGEILGLEEVPRPEKGLWYILHNSLLHLSEAETEAGGQLAFWASNVYRAAQVLEDAGMPIEWDEIPKVGVERFMTRDPFGNSVEVQGYDSGR